MTGPSSSLGGRAPYRSRRAPPRAPTRSTGRNVVLPMSRATEAFALPERRLVGWNVAMALFHLTLGVATLAAGRVDLTVPVYRTALDFRRRNGTGWDLFPHYVRDGALPFTVLTALFFFLSSLFHALNATLLRRYYLAELAACRTPTRWIEYSLSAPTMIVLVAYTLGVRDRLQLLSVAALVATTMPFGYWTETIARPSGPDAWTRSLGARVFPWVLGHVPQLAAWAVIVAQFYSAGYDAADTVPWFVHLILWGELVLFFSFGAAALLSQLGPPRLFYRGELLFQALSLGSKGLLGGILLSNVLMLSRFEDIFE